MKAFKTYLLLTFLLISISSCKDEDADSFASIIGSWEFVSGTTDGVPDPDEECPFELEFTTSNQIIVTDYYGDNCEEFDGYTERYSIDGDELTIVDDIEEYTVVISELTETTLEIIDTYDNEVYVEIYRRL